MSRLRRMALAVVLCISPQAESWAGGYAFTNIVDSTMSAPVGLFRDFGFSTDGVGFYNIPVATSGDRVAFLGTYSTGSEGVFVGSGGPLTTIVKSGDPGPLGSFFRFSEIGISGSTVTFFGRFSSPSLIRDGVFSGSGGPLTTIGSLGSARFPATGDDTVAFVDSIDGDGGILVDEQGMITPYVLPGSPAPNETFTGFRELAIDNGTVAFTGDYPEGHGVFISAGDGVTTIARTGEVTSAGILSGLSGASIAENQVSFLGSFDGSTKTGIFVGDGSTLNTIAKVGDVTPYGTLTRFLAPAISGDTVAFQGFWNGGSAIFLADQGAMTTVIKTGDPLFGSTLTNFGFQRFGLDPEGSGSIAFAYVLADGRLGVARASLIPEPNSVLVLATALFSMLGWRRRVSGRDTTSN